MFDVTERYIENRYTLEKYLYVGGSMNVGKNDEL